MLYQVISHREVVIGISMHSICDTAAVYMTCHCSWGKTWIQF